MFFALYTHCRLCTVHNDKSLQVYQYNGHEMEKKLDIPTVHDFDINDIAIVTSRTGDIRVATVSGTFF